MLEAERQLHGKTRGISRRHLLAFGAAVGLPERVATRALDGLLARLASLVERLRDGALPFPEKTTADVIAELRYRRREASA